MANIKITELDAATTLASTDVLVAVDVSEDVTKKTTVTDLFRTLPDGTAAAPSLSFVSDAGNGVFLAGTDTVGISTGGTQRFTVDGSGNVTISGGLTVEGQTTTVESVTVTIDDKNIELGSVASPSNTTADGGGITLKGGTDKTIKWINSTGYWTFNTGIDVGGNIELADNNKIRLGTSGDLEIYHDGSHSRIVDSGTGNLITQTNRFSVHSADDSETMIDAVENSHVKLYNNGNEKLATKSDGIDVTGEVQCDSLDVDGDANFDGNALIYSASANSLDFQDSVRATFGNSADLQIYHDGSNSYIADTGTGNLFIRANSQLVLESNNGENYLAANENGDVHLYYDGGVRISTTSGGANVVGELECDSLDVDGGIDIDGGKIFYDASTDNLHFGDNVQLRIGTSSDFQIYHDGSASYIADNGTGNLNIQTNGGGVVLTKGSSENLAKFIVDGAVELYYDNSKKLETKSDGIDVTGEVQCDSLDVDGTADFSGNIDCHGDVTLDDSDKLRFGAGDFQIYHNGGNVNQSFIDNNVGDLNLRNLADDKDITLQTDNGSGGLTTYVLCDGSTGSTKLNYLGSEKLQTKSDGILVQGEVQSDSLDVNGAIDVTNSSAGSEVARFEGAYSGSGNVVLTNWRRAGGAVAANLQYHDSSPIKMSLGTTTSHNFALKTGDTDRLTVENSGRIGIGTSVPTHSLEIKGSFPDFAIVDSDTTNDKFRILHNGGGTQLMVDPNNVGPNASYFLVSVDGSEVARIDSSGRLLVGTTSDVSGGLSTTLIQGAATGGGYVGLARNDTSVDDGNGIGGLRFYANDPSGYNDVGIVQCVADGTHATNDYPTRLEFHTTADNASSPTERMRIGNDGKVYFGDFSSVAAAGYIDKATSGSYELDIVASRSTSTGRDIRFFSRSNSESMRLTSDGDLYLGTTTGSYDFELRRSGTASLLLGSTNAQGALLLLDGDSNGDGAGTDYASIGHSYNSNLEYKNRKTASHTFHVGTNDTELMRLDSSGRLLLGTTTEGQASADNFTVADSGHCGITIRSGTTSEGAIYFSDGTSGDAEYRGQVFYDHDGDYMRFSTAATERFRITSTGAWSIEGASNYGTSGQVLTSNGNDAPTWQDLASVSVGGANAISMNDNVKINFGNSSDLQIYHDGSNSRIDNSVGSLIIKNNSDDQDIILTTDNGSGSTTTYLKCDGSNGEVILNHYGSTKLHTKSDGVDITGELQCDSLDCDGDVNFDASKITFDSSGNVMKWADNVAAYFGTGNDLRIYHNGSDSYIQDAGTGVLAILGSEVRIQNASGNENCAKFIQDGAVELYYDNSKKIETNTNGVRVSGRIEINGTNGRIEYNNTANTFEFFTGGNKVAEFLSGGHFVPGTNNTYDLGSSSYRWRNVYTNDLNLSNEGSGNDVDGTWGNYTIQEGEDDLFLINRRNGKKYKFNLTEVS